MDAMTPFLNENKNGTPKKFSELEIFDILQIEERNIEEGYQVEYKQNWDDNFKKMHLCKVITSFANSQGGFLLVGIQDKTGKYIGINEERTDFSVTITQKLAAVSPMPKFECRFLKNEEDGKGVLIIYVHEGIDPPYICDGTVYIRNGSSKVPVKPGRIEIDTLVQKRENYLRNRESFCKNDFFDRKMGMPYCTIYLYNSAAQTKTANWSELYGLRDRLKKNRNIQRVCASAESVICYGSKNVAVNHTTSVMEIFSDGHAKVCVPLVVVDKVTHDKHNALLQEMGERVDATAFTLVNGYISYDFMARSIQKILEEFKISGCDFNNYEVCFEYKNIQDTMLVFPYSTEIKSELKKKIKRDIDDGVYFNLKSMYKSSFVKISEKCTQKEADTIAMELVADFFLLFYGIDGDAFFEKLSEVENPCGGKPISIQGYYPKIGK